MKCYICAQKPAAYMLTSHGLLLDPFARRWHPACLDCVWGTYKQAPHNAWPWLLLEPL